MVENVRENVRVEKYFKKKGGRVYRDVLFNVGERFIIVDNILAKDDETAYQKALKYLRKAIEL